MDIIERMNAIKNKVKIEDYVSIRYKLQLEGTGNYMKGACPFECLPESKGFTIIPIKQIFYCFGCHKGGDLITLVAEKEKKSHREAYLILEKHYWKKLVNEIKLRIANDEPKDQTQEKITELKEIHEFLLENNCI